MVDTERLRNSVKTLADDAFEGRAPGLPGGDRAAQYMADQFKNQGLEPAGEDGSYFQPVPLVGVTTLPATTFRLITSKGVQDLRLWDDYTVNNQKLRPLEEIDAPIVFVGFGIHAPQYGWDDYKQVDLHGKVALLFVNEPISEKEDFFRGRALTYSGRWTYKYEETARRGALATLIIHRTDLAAYPWQVVRNSWSSEKAYLQDEAPALQAAAWLQLSVAQQLLADCGYDLDQLYLAAQSKDFQPIQLPARVQAKVVSEVRHFQSRNVLARRPGTDRSEEAVIYSAHYDHLGIRPDQKGDNIYNGALDNASGCAILLELSRIFAGLPVAPRRTVLFVATTAEEQGLLGAAYLALHPPLPVGSISLDLNFDMVPPLGRPEEITAVGSERTTFGPALEEIAHSLGLTVRPDAHPEAGLYYRMDHFSLAQRGVPGFSVGEGLKFAGHPPEWGQKFAADYTAHHYHQPSDEYHADWDFLGLSTFVQFAYQLGLRAAQQEELVQWLPGDEFEAARLKSLP